MAVSAAVAFRRFRTGLVPVSGFADCWQTLDVSFESMIFSENRHPLLRIML
jgi:hypothetical protein